MQFDISSNFYDLLYSDKEYDKEVSYIHSIIQNKNQNAVSIIEFGSGTGKHGLKFKEKGYKIYGIEKNHFMIHYAKKNGFPCHQADIIDFKLETRFDVAVALFHVISYLVENDDVEKTFINAANHLNENGLFIFDVWYMPAVLHQKPEIRIKKIQDDKTEIIRIATPKTHFERNVVDVNYTFLVKNKLTNQWSEFEETHSMRYFSYPEISYIAKSTGFKLVKAEEFLTGNTPSPDTWGVCFVLKKV